MCWTWLERNKPQIEIIISVIMLIGMVCIGVRQNDINEGLSDLEDYVELFVFSQPIVDANNNYIGIIC